MGSLAWRRVNEIVGMLMVGDGMIAMAHPVKHVELWRGGPPAWDRVMGYFSERPMLTRAFGAAELGFGIWLMLRQIDMDRPSLRQTLRRRGSALRELGQAVGPRVLRGAEQFARAAAARR